MRSNSKLCDHDFLVELAMGPWYVRPFVPHLYPTSKLCDYDFLVELAMGPWYVRPFVQTTHLGGESGKLSQSTQSKISPLITSLPFVWGYLHLKYNQVSPNTAKYNQINPNKSEWNQIKPDTIKHNKSKISPASSQLLPSYGAFCTWNTTKYHQIQPNTAKYSQSKILLRMVWNGDKIGRVPFLTPWPPLTPSPLGGGRWCPKKNWWEKCFF